MSAPLLIMIALAGGVGAVLRWVIDTAVQRRLGARFAWGTMIINVTGSLLLGTVVTLVSGAVLPSGVGAVIGTGLLGGYTTFSAASVETVRLVRAGRWAAALLNGPGMLLLAVAAALLGALIGSLVLTVAGN